jgi:polyisoprenoid-binding protein YceI
MKEKYLEAGKYPEALLIIPKQKLAKGSAAPFEGELVMHGTKQKISGKAEIATGEGGKKTVKASFRLKLEDHGIEIPKFAGISVANEVSVETDLELAGTN